jgi:hypothetical protein
MSFWGETLFHLPLKKFFAKFPGEQEGLMRSTHPLHFWTPYRGVSIEPAFLSLSPQISLVIPIFLNKTAL